MSEQDKIDIAELIKGSKESQTMNVRGVIDAIVKLISGFTLLGIGWLGSTNIDLGKQMAVVQEQLKDMKEFTNEPRFTESNFNQKILPVQNQVNGNTSDIHKIEVLQEGYSDDVNEMKLQIQQLQSDINNNP